MLSDPADSGLNAVIGSKKVTFGGLTFDLTVDRTQPICHIAPGKQSTALTENKPLLDFLQSLKQHGLLETETNSGKVVYADDQFFNQQSMKMNF